MTTTGIQVTGSHGVLQIDELYKNLVKRAKGTIPNTGAGVSFAGATSPLLACRTLDTGGVGLNFITISSGTWTWASRQIPVSTTYWVFDVAPASPAHGTGVQVFDASGNTVFDNFNEYLKIVGQVTLNYPTGGAVSTFRQPSGKTYGWILICNGAWTKDNLSGQTDTGDFGVYMDANGDLVTSQQIPYGSHSGPSINGSVVNVTQPIVLVVDVTGM